MRWYKHRIIILVAFVFITPTAVIMALQMIHHGDSVGLAAALGVGVGVNLGWFAHAITKRNAKDSN